MSAKAEWQAYQRTHRPNLGESSARALLNARAQALSDNTSPVTSTVVAPQAELAAQINTEHGLAQQAVETAVQHAVECGDLLMSVKASLKHGEFMPWITQNCEFEQSTATRYMNAARQIATGVGISSLRSLFPSGNANNRRLAGKVKITKTDTQVREIEDHDHAGGEDHAGGGDDGGEQGVQQPNHAEHVADGAGHGDDVQQLDHGEQVVGGADHVDDDDNPETPQERSEIAALLRAWVKASPKMRALFIVVKSAEIIATAQTVKRAA